MEQQPNDILCVFVVDEFGDTQHAALCDTVAEIIHYLNQFSLSLGDGHWSSDCDNHFIIKEG